MNYVGSRHDEIAAMLSPGEEPQPQRLLPGLSIDGSTIGRGESESRIPSGAVTGPQELRPRPRPENLQAEG